MPPEETRPEPAPVGRLAPSPTGRLHLGHARSFLLAWWSMRARGGTVRLRIEDLDRARVRPGAVDTVLRDLEWLGLDWDGAPLHQSHDPAPYAEAVNVLLAGGHAYPCTCSRRDVLAVQSAPHGEEGELRYPGTCRGRYRDVADAERASGSPAGVRLRVAPGPVRWHDALLGPRVDDVAADVGDVLIARRDGVYAYQLAVVVDDARQGVTEVLRGDDLAPSTPRQLLLQRALGLPSPTWAHVPLVVDATGRRLAKRDGDLALAELRAAGVDPRRVVRWVAAGAGMPEAGGLLDAAARLPHVDLDRLPRHPVRLGPEDLDALRG